MLKSIIFLVELLVFLLAVLVFSLMYGFTLSNLSYENINIGQLYIKYDKNLIVQSNSVQIIDKKTNKKHNFELNASIDRYDDKYFLQINKLYYKNHNLKLKTNIDLNDTEVDQLLNYKIDNLKLSDFSFIFDKNVKAVKTKNTFITYKDDNLYFILQNPTLDNIKLDNSKVILRDISSNILLELDLNIQHTLDKKLLDIFKYYKVPLDIKQYKGENNIYINAKIPFSKEKDVIYVKVNSKNTKILYESKLINAKNLEVEYKNNIITIKSNNGVVNINNKDIYYDDLNLVYKNNIANIKSKKGFININDRNITFNNLKVKYENNILYINSKNGFLNILDNKTKYNDLYLDINNSLVNIKSSITQNNIDINIDSFINLKNSKSNGVVKINKIYYKNLLELKDIDTFYTLDYKDNSIDLYLKKLKLHYNFDGFSKHTININDISKFSKKLNFLEINSKKNENIIINTFNHFNTTDIYVNNLKLNIDEKRYDKFRFNIDKGANGKKINIYIKNSILGYDKRYLDIKDANIIKDKISTTINIIPNDNSSIIDIKIKDKKINIKGDKISSSLINRLLKSDKIKGGYVDVDIVINNNTIKGSAKLHKNTIKNLRALNNLITFINTTPAYFNPLLALPTLFHLGESKFDLNGYYIKNGNFNFIYNRDNRILNINSLYTKGVMADFKGDIISNFKNKTIKANLDVIFLKDYSRVIKNIPLLGYIIVGDDGNFLTNVNIDGTFEKQTFKTHVFKDTTKGILNVIKRTISIPLLPFKKEKK